ncbi:hypothetical protein AAVH_39154, partial [Aphelenchoides avenae]
EDARFQVAARDGLCAPRGHRQRPQPQGPGVGHRHEGHRRAVARHRRGAHGRLPGDGGPPVPHGSIRGPRAGPVERAHPLRAAAEALEAAARHAGALQDVSHSAGPAAHRRPHRRRGGERGHGPPSAPP